MARVRQPAAAAAPGGVSVATRTVETPAQFTTYEVEHVALASPWAAPCSAVATLSGSEQVVPIIPWQDPSYFAFGVGFDPGQCWKARPKDGTSATVHEFRWTGGGPPSGPVTFRVQLS
jgi:hypothetical protein